MNISLLMILLAMLIFNAGLRLKISYLKNIWLAGLAAIIAFPIVYIFGVIILMRLWSKPIEVRRILVGLTLH
ncbi:MAG: hypothetical protein ABL869_07310 [Candidatus Nitrotoga sp.]